MRIYITTQGARVTKEGRHLLVRHGETSSRTIFIHKLKQLIICGNVQVTPSARNMLFRNSIDTVFLTRNGRYVGRFAHPEPKNIQLRKRQFGLADNQEFGLDFSKQVVTGKLANMSTLLMRIHRKKNKRHIADKARKIRRLIKQARSAETFDSLRGYEGQGSALYFSLFNSGFDVDQGFSCRVRRPPTDPVNAVLSLLYTFLYNQVYSAVRQVNLDPYIGYLHTLDYGRYSLVLDLMEEFRPVVVDTLVFALFNMDVLNRDEDFQVVEEELESAAEDEKNNNDIGVEITGGEEPANEQFDVPVQRVEEIFTIPAVNTVGRRPINLHKQAMKRVIGQFERKLATPFTYKLEDRKVTYAEAMVGQARQYRKLVEGSLGVYQPLLLK